MPETTVISVRGRDRDALLADPAFLYVGRPVYRGVHWKGSPWANPFKVGMPRARAVSILGRDLDSLVRAERLDLSLCLMFHCTWLRERSGLVGRLGELRGKTLGCWCGDWRPGGPRLLCHAVTLAELANALEAPDA